MFSYLRLTRFLLLGFFGLGLAGCAGQQPVISGLSEASANQIVVVLKSQDIKATKVAPVVTAGQTPTFSITVSGSDFDDALKILVDNKLPKVASAGYATVYAGGSSLIPSSTQEKAQYLMALQGEVENMLLVLPGIVEASVVLVLPDPSQIRDPNSPAPQSSASVAVVYNPSDNQGNPQVSAYDIQYLVGSAVPDLPSNNVTVVMATNSPLKLIDGKKAIAKSVSTKAAAPTQPAGPAASPGATTAKKTTATATTTEPSGDRSDFLITLFGALAAIGLLFGVLGLVRSISLRAKLARMEGALPGSAGAAQVSAPPPSSEATVGAGE